MDDGWDGTGVGIAIIDSGILEGRDLLSSNSPTSTRIVYSQSFVRATTSAADQYGHGTHVAGIAAGNGAISTGPTYFTTFRGIAPNAKLINLRVLDAKGVGTDSAVIAAIDKAIQLKNKHNIRIINLSLGRPVRNRTRRTRLSGSRKGMESRNRRSRRGWKRRAFPEHVRVRDHHVARE